MHGDETPAALPTEAFWNGATPVRDRRRAYVQHLDDFALASWAEREQVALCMLVRPGDHVFPGSVVARVLPANESAEAQLLAATALGAERTAPEDPEYAIRQLVEVAVRALSRGINDPYTVLTVLDRLGASLCDMAARELPRGIRRCSGGGLLQLPTVNYDGLTDAMFHMIRQESAAIASAPVLIRMMEVLAAVAACEARPERRLSLSRHARLLADDARRSIANAVDLADFLARHDAFRKLALAETETS